MIEDVKCDRLQEEITKNVPFSDAAISLEIDKDEVLHKVKNYIMKGWPEKIKDSRLQDYYVRKGELSVYKGCIIWGSRVIVREKFQNKILQLLCGNHYGMNRMNSLARACIWFPGIDKRIEEITRN